MSPLFVFDTLQFLIDSNWLINYYLNPKFVLVRLELLTRELV